MMIRATAAGNPTPCSYYTLIGLGKEAGEEAPPRREWPLKGIAKVTAKHVAKWHHTYHPWGLRVHAPVCPVMCQDWQLLQRAEVLFAGAACL